MSHGGFVATAGLACTLLAACAELEDDGPASPEVAVIDRRMDAVVGASDIEFINGAYTNCAGRSGSWSLAVNGNPSMAHPALSVIKGNTTCSLAITALKTGSDGLLSASAPISLGTSYGTARSFGTPISFYANARLDAAAFGGGFTLTLLFSDSPRTIAGSSTASYSEVSATASATGVSAPNYTMDLSSVVVTTDISKVSTSVSGNVVLTAGSNTGDYYAIVSGAVGDTHAEIQTAYNAATPVAMSTSIAASSVLAIGVSLSSPVVRTLIVAKATNGVSAYQKFAITFNGPS